MKQAGVFVTKELFCEIENYMKECVKETAHDTGHIYRVLGNCLKIAANESQVDYDILLTAALLHDIGRDGQKKKHNETGAQLAEDFLKTTAFPQHKIKAVYEAIFTHSNSSYGQQKTLEAKILYDADKLDAVGVMGIARSLIGVGNYNNPMYVIEDGKVDISEQSETDTFVRYYVRNLAKNYDRFFTKTARNIAEKSRKIDEEFFTAFLNTVSDNYKQLDCIDELLK
ncbi:MAG: HD domain-containing protein [Clostridia bacterium]|nr:HD domain-containing protein [Clostridia bacterium]